jgi:hypothetical protein
MDHLELDRKISRLQDIIRYESDRSQSLKAAWDLVKEISQEFKQVRYPTREERNTAWNGFQEIVETVKEARQKQRDADEHQAELLTDKINDLADRLRETSYNAPSWKEIWASIKDISNAFKRTRFPSKDAREDQWKRFQNLIDDVKEQQEKEQKERDRRSERSADHRDQIISRANSARPLSDFESAIADMFLLIPTVVADVATLGLFRTQIDEKKAELQACSKTLKEAWNLFSDYKEEMFGQDKSKAYHVLNEVQDEINAAWDAWRKSQNEYHQASQSARREKIEGQISKLESRLDNLNNILARAENHLSELHDKRDSARSDDYRYRVDDWINEEERKIDSIKSQIDEVEGWLQEARQKLWS